MPHNGGSYTRAYCDHCKRNQPIDKQFLSAEVLELVCKVCHSVVATLYK